MKLGKAMLAAAMLMSGSVVLADDAYLRLRCDGEAAGAEVRINGVKKGECPIDLAVPEGNVKLSVRKSLNQYSYKLYEKDMLLSAGAMKREVVTLGPLMFTPEGQRIEDERLAGEKARAAAEQERLAREKAEAEAKAAALAEQRRREAEEAAKYGMVNEYMDALSSHREDINAFTWTTFVAYSPLFLPMSTLSDLSSGKKLIRTAADPAVFANPDSMVARASRQQAEPAL